MLYALSKQVFLPCIKVKVVKTKYNKYMQKKMSVYMSRSIYSIFLLSTLFFISRERLIFGPRMNVLLKIFKNILRILASNVLKTFLNIIVSIEFTLTTLHMHDTNRYF